MNPLIKMNYKDFQKVKKNYPPKTIKYFACGEYGDKKKRAHYHAIIFGVGNNHEDKKIIQETWKKGLTYHGTVTFESARYVTDYVLKKNTMDEKRQKSMEINKYPFV